MKLKQQQQKNIKLQNLKCYINELQKPQSLSHVRVKLFDGFCMFIKPLPSEQMHVFELCQLMHAICKMLQKQNQSFYQLNCKLVISHGLNVFRGRILK